MSSRLYDDYRDSGVDWLGAVPAHWALKRLAHYFDERRAKVSDKDYPPLSVTKKGIVPQLETAAKTDDGDNRKLVLAGDFVINSRSDRKGSSGLSELDGSVSLINTVLEPNSDIEGRFAHHLLRSAAFQEEYYRFGKGIVADLWSTNFSEMRNILLAVPPLSEQRAIAVFLDRETANIDSLLEEQRRLVELLKEKRQAVITQAVTKGLDPGAPMKSSGVEWLGEVPAHWEVNRLGRLMRFSSGKAHEPYLDETGAHIYISARFVSTQGTSLKFCSKNVSPACRGDVVMVMSDLPNGRALARAYAIKDDASYAVNQRVCRLYDFRGSSRYFYYQLDRNPGLLRYNDGVNQTHLSNAAFRKLALCAPPKKEQAEIADHLDEVVSHLDALEAAALSASALLQERRAAVISAAVTGRIEVHGAEAMQTEAA